jgi:hypothetical protein
MKNKLLSIAFILLGTVSGQAQEVNTKGPRQFAVSLQSGNYYDLQYTSFDDLLNGASGEDMHGLNGPNTTFDVGAGLRLHYYYSPLLSFELGYDRATVTGANSVEWHSSKNEAYSLAMKFDLKKSSLIEEYTTVPFLRIGTGMLNYDATRSFVSDGIMFSTAVGSSTFSEVGGGIQHHFTDALSVNMQSSFRIINTDAWDGYDYSSGRDHLMMTTVGVEYAFGGNKHMNRLPSYRDSRVNQLMNELETIKSNENSMMELIQHNSEDNAALKKDLEAMKKGIEELAETQAAFMNSNATAEELGTYRIYYGFNKANIEDEFAMELQKRVFALEGKDVVYVLQAFSDAKGTSLSNSLIRQKRLNKATELLKSWGISEDNIEIQKWNGEHTGDDQLDRRLEVTIKNK